MSVAFVLIPCAAAAQPARSLVRVGENGLVGEVAAYGEVGLDGAIGTTLGVAVGLRPLGERANVAAFGDVTWFVGNPDFDDWRMRTGLRAQLVRYGVFRLDAAIVPEMIATSNDAFSAIAFGTDFRIAPGIEAGRWVLEINGSLDQRWITHVSFSDAYQTLAYNDAHSGWYGLTGRSIRVGGRVAVRLASFEISVAAGWEEAGRFVFPPVYANIGVAWSFAAFGGGRSE
jgi:hypothetical protein